MQLINIQSRDAKQKEYSLSLLPDSVREVSDGIEYRNDGEYLYIQYMVAKGYSEYWKSNMFILTTLIISKKPGNTGISRDIRTEFTTDLLLSD